MAKAADLRALEDDVPWERDAFRAGLASLTSSSQAASKQFAAELVVLAALAAQVPRCLNDEAGASPWTSFLREIAVARRCSDRAAASDVRAAVRLTTALPRTFGLLQDGVMTIARAKAMVTELEPHDDALAGEVDAELADQATIMPVWRIAGAVRKAVLRLDADAVGQRVAVKNASRGVALTPGRR